MTIEKLREILNDCYSKELCYPKIKEYWNQSNKTYGMCAITTLIVNDYFGGDIGKVYVRDISHYFNILNGKIIDLTKEQFDIEPNYNDYVLINRNDMLNEDTKMRYESLKMKMERIYEQD